MAANGNAKNAETPVENTEAPTETEEVVQILFKVPKSRRNELKIVAILENKDGLQDLFSSVSDDLVGRHADALKVLTQATNAA